MSDDLTKKTLEHIFSEKRTGTSERRISGTMRGSNRRTKKLSLNPHDRAVKAIEYHEKSKIPKVPITQELPRVRTYGQGGAQGTRIGLLQRSTASAESYLAKKATKGAMGTIGTAAKVGGKLLSNIEAVPNILVSTAGMLGHGVISIAKAKHEEREAKLGTKMLKSGMKYAKLKKALSEPGREGFPGNIKVN